MTNTKIYVKAKSTEYYELGAFMSNNIDKTVLDKIKQIPKVELHLHLEGSVRKDTLKEMVLRNSQSDFNLEEIDKVERYRDLGHFVSTMRSVMDLCIKKPEDYERITYELINDLNSQNVIYAEISFDPSRGKRIGISIDDIIVAVINGKRRAETETTIKIGLIIGAGREHGLSVVDALAQKAIEYQPQGIIGFDLHGNESSASPEVFSEIYKMLYKNGLGLRAHAGEGNPSENIWKAIKDLQVTRIGHGVSAIDDEKLIDFLIEKNITLDMCVKSNFMLNIVEDYKKHPIKQLFDKGVKVTISSDDPLFFNSNITKEYCLLVEELNFTMDDIYILNRNALEASFADINTKDFCFKQIESIKG